MYSLEKFLSLVYLSSSKLFSANTQQHYIHTWFIQYISNILQFKDKSEVNTVSTFLIELLAVVPQMMKLTISLCYV